MVSSLREKFGAPMEKSPRQEGGISPSPAAGGLVLCLQIMPVPWGWGLGGGSTHDLFKLMSAHMEISVTEFLSHANLIL